MSRCIFFLATIFSFFNFYAQSNTEVFLFDFETKDSQIKFSNFKNISNNEGYDSQPSFLDDNIILFSSNRKGQTDIAKYYINYDSKSWLNFTDGSEYSPLKIPNLNAVSAIRLDKDGKQFLYNYNLSNGESNLLIDNLIIGYHTWFSDKLLISSVLENDLLALYTTDFNDMENYKFHNNIGRSLHKVPNTELVSFISKTNEPWEIKTLNPKTGKIKSITTTLTKAEDMCWLNDGTILMGQESIVYKFKPNHDVDWIEIADLKQHGISKISRLAVSSNGRKIAIVGEEISKEIKSDSVKTLEPKLKNVAWIAGNWKGEAFGGKTEENWSEPSGDSMMGVFKLLDNGKVSFYEIEIIREVNNTLILQLKHFNNDLKGWETKDETVDFPLKEITENKIVFEGMTFEKVNDNEMNVYVDIKQDDGKVEIVKFNYKK